MQQYTRERLQRLAETSPAVVKPPCDQPADRSCYFRPSHFYPTADTVTVYNEHKIHWQINPQTEQQERSTRAAFSELLLVLLRFGPVCTRSILTVKGFPLDLQVELTDHRECYPKPSLKLVIENLRTNIIEKLEHSADTPPRKLHSEASGAPYRHPLIRV